MGAENPIRKLLSLSWREIGGQTRVVAEDVKRSDPGFIWGFRTDRTADRLHVIAFAALLSFSFCFRNYGHIFLTRWITKQNLLIIFAPVLHL